MLYVLDMPVTRRKVNHVFWRSIVLPLRLQQLHLEIYPVLGDGNCVYRAIAYGNFGNAEFHQQVRTAIVAAVRVNIDHFRAFHVPNNDNEPGTIEDAIGELRTSRGDPQFM